LGRNRTHSGLHNYLYQGGNVLLLRGVTDKELTNFDELMEDYGMTIRPDTDSYEALYIHQFQDHL